MKLIQQLKFCSLLCVVLLSGITQAQTQIGNDIEGQAAGDEFGISMDMAVPSSVVIGGRMQNSAPGYAAVYDLVNGSWQQRGSVLNGDGTDDEYGYSVSMADENTIAVGARLNDVTGFNTGQAKIFTWNGTSWVQKGADIQGPSDGGDCQLGFSVAMPNPNTIAVGIPRYSGIQPLAGQARVYDWDGSNWIQRGSPLNGEAAIDEFGRVVHMPDENTIAVGALFNDASGADAGHARVYTWNGSSWNQKGADIDGESAGDYFGYSLNMPDENTIAIGGLLNDDAGQDAGHVRVLDWDGAAWIQRGSDIDGLEVGESFGYKIDMPNPNLFAAGANANDGNGSNAGAVRVYAWNGIDWEQQGAEIQGENSDDRFGFSVSMPDNFTVGAGARLNDGNGFNSGHVRAFSLCTSVICDDGDPSTLDFCDPSLGCVHYPAPPGSGDALSFEGVDDHVQIPGVPSMNPGTSSLTVSAWVKTSVVPNQFAHVVQRYGYGGIGGGPGGLQPDSYTLTINDEGQAGFSIRNSTNVAQFAYSNSFVADGNWHHIVGVRDVDGGQFQLYVDGILEVNETLTASGTINPGNNILIGAGEVWNASGHHHHFTGSIDEVRIWNGVGLTQSEIRDHMCQKDLSSHPQIANLAAYYRFDDQVGSTGLQDISGNGNHGTLTNMNPATDWVTSGAPIGDLSAQGYGTATVTLTDGTSLTADNLTGSPDGVHVYKVNEAPNEVSLPVNYTGLEASEYYGVHVVGGSSPTYDATWNYSTNPNIDGQPNENEARLASRSDNAAGAFSDIFSQSLDDSGNTVTVQNQNGTEYIIGFGPHPCAAGTYELNGECVLCPPGFYCPGDGNSYPCAAGTFQGLSGQTSCNDCAAGFFSGSVGSTSCQPCEAGSFSNITGASECTDCPAGTANNQAGQTQCTDCPAGSFSATAGSTECDLCPSGTYQDVDGANECLDCDAGSVSDPGATACVPCAAGEYESGGQCLVCPPGTYCPGDGISYPCAAGEFSATSGAVSCQACEAGSFSATTGATSCTSCPVGTFQSGTGSTECIACSAGTSQNQTGQTSCVACPAGTFSSFEGAENCTACPAGTANNETGQTECTNCPAGSFSATAGSTECDLCPADTYSEVSGSSECIACPNGSSSDPGSVSCDICDPGYFDDNGTCTLCPPGYCCPGDNNSYPNPTGTDTLTACISLTWIDGVTYTENNYTATHLLVGAAVNGCDSLVTLHLTFGGAACPPVAQCQPVTEDADNSCQAAVAASQFDNGSYDTDNEVISFSAIPPGPYGLGTTPVQLIAEDAFGNTDTCSTQITVVDNTDPTLSGMPGDISISTDPGECQATVSWTEPVANDNCSVDMVSSNYNSGDTFIPGTYDVDYTVTDVAGNEVTYGFEIEVLDNNEPPQVFCSTPATRTVNQSNATYLVAGDEFDPVSVSDNCSDPENIVITHNAATLTGVIAGPDNASLDGWQFPEGENNVVFTAADENSNQSSCNFEVEVVPVEISGNAVIPTQCSGMDVRLRLYLAGTASLAGEFSTVSDVNGDFSAPLPGIGLGNYDVYLKLRGYLQRSSLNQNLDENGVAVSINSLIPGDISGPGAFNDDLINGSDLSYMLISYYSLYSDPSYLPASDLNCDGVINGLDLALLAYFYLESGESP